MLILFIMCTFNLIELQTHSLVKIEKKNVEIYLEK